MTAKLKGDRAQRRAEKRKQREAHQRYVVDAMLYMSDIVLHHAKSPHGIDCPCAGCGFARRAQGIHEKVGQLELMKATA